MAEFRCSRPPYLLRHRHREAARRRTPYDHPFVAPPSDAAPRRPPYYTPAVGPSFNSPPRLHHGTPYDLPIHHSFVYDCPQGYLPAAAPSYEGPRRRPCYPLAAAPSYEGPRRCPSYPPAAAPGPRRRPCYPPAAAPSSEGPRPQATVNTDALLPHQILASALNNNEEHARMAEHRWERMVSALRSQGKFRNSIAVYHVSTNMSETAKQVSIAMALLISELSQPPWKGKVFKFHEDPALFDIEGNSIVDKAKFLRDHVHCSWPQYYLDYEMVFRDILKVAKDGKQKQDEMIKRVFLFTDCSFQTSSYYRAKVHGKSHYWLDDSWKHEYPMLRSMFSKAGYAMPKIVFWDLTDIPWVCSDTEPFTDIPSVYSDTECSDTEEFPRMPEGVTQMVGGMSNDLLELFLEKDALLMKNDFIKARCDHIDPIHEQ